MSGTPASSESSELESISETSGDEEQEGPVVAEDSPPKDFSHGLEHDSDDGSQSDGPEDVSHVQFEVLDRLKSTGERSSRVRKTRRMNRLNKNRPLEMSSKRPVSSFKTVLHGDTRPTHRDPRFESLSGDYKLSRFRQQYSFLYDEVMPGEAQTIKKLVKRTRNPEHKQEMVKELRLVENQIREEKERKKQEDRSRKLKVKELEAVKGGKRPFYLSKRKKREAELLEKFKELQESGKLDTYMEKMRKRKAAKDHKLIPSKRRG